MPYHGLPIFTDLSYLSIEFISLFVSPSFLGEKMTMKSVSQCWDLSSRIWEPWHFWWASSPSQICPTRVLGPSYWPYSISPPFQRFVLPQCEVFLFIDLSLHSIGPLLFTDLSYHRIVFAPFLQACCEVGDCFGPLFSDLSYTTVLGPSSSKIFTTGLCLHHLFLQVCWDRHSYVMTVEVGCNAGIALSAFEARGTSSVSPLHRFVIAQCRASFLHRFVIPLCYAPSLHNHRKM